MWYVYRIEYYSAIKMNEILSFSATWMDLESEMLSKINKSEKEKSYMILVIRGI